jgi:predicted RNase H-like nuclease
MSRPPCPPRPPCRFQRRIDPQVPATTFIGIDLAWKLDGNHSGVAVLSGNERQVRLVEVSAGIHSLSGLLEFVALHAGPDCVIAIDASLVVRNTSGQRPCERLIAQTFGRYHAACHPTNLRRPHATTGMDLVAALAALGFLHDFDIQAAQQRRGRWLFEVYPHPAMVRTFGLPQILKYKKGSVAQKRRGLALLRQFLIDLAGGSRGWVESRLLHSVAGRDLQNLRGAALKHYEDTLDAMFCAYLAWHCWRWGAARNEVFGSLAEGYIVVPRAAPR